MRDIIDPGEDDGLLCGFAGRIRSKNGRGSFSTHSSEVQLAEAGAVAPVAPDTPADASYGHHTAPGSMTSLLGFPENANMEVLAEPDAIDGVHYGDVYVGVLLQEGGISAFGERGRLDVYEQPRRRSTDYCGGTFVPHQVKHRQTKGLCRAG